MPTQVGRGDYFRAAMQILAADGAGALKIGVLCRSLGVTTGSFYHHFGSLRTFIELLLVHWEQEQTETYAELAAAAEEPDEGFEVLKQAVIGLPHRAEAGIRAWSHLDPQVSEAQARVDQKRREAIQQVLRQMIRDPERVEGLVLVGLTLLTGFQQGGNADSVDEITALVEEYEFLIQCSADVRPPLTAGGVPRRAD
jgi:AcrR family transcriptional regulator